MLLITKIPGCDKGDKGDVLPCCFSKARIFDVTPLIARTKLALSGCSFNSDDTNTATGARRLLLGIAVARVKGAGYTFYRVHEYIGSLESRVIRLDATVLIMCSEEGTASLAKIFVCATYQSIDRALVMVLR